MQDVRTDIGSPGEGAIYTFPDSSLIKKFTTDSNGKFSISLDSIIPGDSVYLQARLNSGNPSDNFVRTKVLPNRDQTVVARAYPYNSTLSNNGISRDEIRAHVQELNPGFDKWNLENLLGVEIVDVDPLGRGSFTPEEQNTIEQTFRENITCYTGGKLNDIYIQKDNAQTQRHYTTNQNGISLENNWIYFFPDTTITKSGTNFTIDGSGVIINSIIHRRKNVSNPSYTDAHEAGHVFIAPSGHATTLPGTVTIMRGDVQSPLNSPGPTDCEAAYIINEDTFAPREPYHETLGTDFFGSYYP